MIISVGGEIAFLHARFFAAKIGNACSPYFLLFYRGKECYLTQLEWLRFCCSTRQPWM